MTNILGRERLARKLKALPEQVKVRVRGAMGAAADDIVSMMKALVPEASGALKESIGWTWGKAPKGSIAVASVSNRSGDMTITIFAGNDKAYYARWVEFGTQAHSLAKNASVARGLRQGEGRSHTGTKAQPFFYVSYRAKRKQAKSRISRAITKAAKEIAAGR